MFQCNLKLPPEGVLKRVFFKFYKIRNQKLEFYEQEKNSSSWRSFALCSWKVNKVSRILSIFLGKVKFGLYATWGHCAFAQDHGKASFVV